MPLNCYIQFKAKNFPILFISPLKYIVPRQCLFCICLNIWAVTPGCKSIGSTQACTLCKATANNGLARYVRRSRPKSCYKR